MTLTLWDIIEPIRKRFGRPAGPPQAPMTVVTRPVQPTNGQIATARAHRRPAAKPVVDSAQARYDAVARQMLERYQIRVRKWRKNMSGIAWYVTYADGRRQNLIESPRPKGPMSMAIFLHEIGHHAIGFNVYRPRCLEEFHAWRWALEAMREHELNITDSVRYRMHQSLHYAIGKATRRGIKALPEELTPYLRKPVKPTKRAGCDSNARPAA